MTTSPLPRTLADAPLHLACRIESIGLAVRDLGYYVHAGLRRGALARVVARHPERAPRFVEVELGEYLVVSLPMTLAADVVVSECGA